MVGLLRLLLLAAFIHHGMSVAREQEYGRDDDEDF